MISGFVLMVILAMAFLFLGCVDGEESK